jgi:hypothetical protein
MSRFKRTTSTALAAGSLGLAACGGGDEPAPSPTPTARPPVAVEAVTLNNAEETPTLGRNAYVAEATGELRLRGQVAPEGHAASLSLERRGPSRFSPYGKQLRTDSKGAFAVNLPAYRAKSNLYRVTFQGSPGTPPFTVQVYFDRG